jgi:hypothetical protein
MHAAAKPAVIMAGLTFLAALVVLRPTGDETQNASGVCGRAESQSRVVQDACRAIPELSSPGLGDTEATTLLRQWAARWIDISSRSLLIEEHYWQQDIDSLYRRFSANERGAFCGGTAWTLMRLYNAFGFDSWTYNAGPESGMTHVVTLVRAGDSIIVQDAYANYTLTDLRGNPLDIRAVLALLRDHRAHEVVIRGEPTRKDYLLTTDELARKRKSKRGDWPWGNRANLRNCSEIRRGVSRCSVPGVSVGRLRLWSVWRDMMERLRRDGLPPAFLYLMVYPLGLTSNADGWTTTDDTPATPTRALFHEMLAALAGDAVQSPGHAARLEIRTQE